MSKGGLLVLCLVALVAGIGWVVTAGLPLVYAIGVVAVVLCLGGFSLVLGK